MKKLLLIISFLLFTLPVWAGVATGLKVGVADYSAVLDSCPADIISAPVGTRISIYDSSGKFLSGLKGANCPIGINQVYSVGDSLTFLGLYETSLSQLLGYQWRINNRGISANTSTQISSRFTRDVITPGDAYYVIIWAGIVDVIQDVSAAAIESNLQAMYTAAHNAGIKVITINLPPFKNYSWTSGRQVIHDAVNTWIANTAINIDYKIDAYSLLVDGGNPYTLLPAYDSGDNLHLSATGFSVIANALYSAAPWTHTPTTPVGATYNPLMVTDDTGTYVVEIRENVIWKWLNGTWTAITNINDTYADQITAGTTVYAVFNTGGGIYSYDGTGTSFTQITIYTPVSMIAIGSSLYAAYTNQGISKWDGASWTQITPYNPVSMASHNGYLYADFGGTQQNYWNGTTWIDNTGMPNDYSTVNGYLFNTSTRHAMFTPSSTGIILLNTVGGVQSWTSKDTNFIYNAGSYADFLGTQYLPWY